MDQEAALEILLVEDNPHDAEMTIRALTRNKISERITHLTDGAQALDFLFGKGKYQNRNVENKPKLILLDLKMPKLNGIEVLQALKSNELTKKIPVVMLTASKENPDVETCYTLGANSYIVKPVEFEKFVRAVTESGMYWMTHNYSLQ